MPPISETRNFDCTVRGYRVYGAVTSSGWEITDYAVNAIVVSPKNDLVYRTFTFDMRMVSTPPRFKVPHVRDGEQTKYLNYDKAMVASECFEYTLGLCVDWFIEKWPLHAKADVGSGA